MKIAVAVARGLGLVAKVLLAYVVIVAGVLLGARSL